MIADDRRDRRGRPLRALALFGLLLGLWLAARLPVLLGDAGRAITAMQPARPLPTAKPPAMLAARAAPLAVAARADPAAPAVAPSVPRHLPRYAKAANLPRFAGARPVAAPPGVAPIASLPPAAPAMPPPGPRNPGFDLATRAYAELAAGNRRRAAGLFQEAIEAGPDPRRSEWQAQRRSLTRRWSAEAYVLARDAGPVNPAAGPLLGGGQAGANLAYTPDPLMRRPLALVARLNAANSDDRSAQAALGLRWQPARGVTLSAERLIAIGENARNDWTLRAAAGAALRRGRAEWSGYGEAGVLGNGDVYAGAQTRATVDIARAGPVAIAAGPAAWASVQTGDAPGAATIHRADIGPTVVARAPLGRLTVEVAADWRFRVAGNAAPDSGPALKLSTRF